MILVSVDCGFVSQGLYNFLNVEDLLSPVVADSAGPAEPKFLEVCACISALACS